MKPIQEEARNLTIEEITRLEADTIGFTFFTKDSPIPFSDDEAPTKYQNLLSGNDRTRNRENFVYFERRNRNIIETLIKYIIPSGQSLFMAQQTDKGIKSFINEKNNCYQSINQTKDTVPDDQAQSTDWINYFTHHDFAEIPDSLSEDNFIKAVYDTFSLIFYYRVQYHNEQEGKDKLIEIFQEYFPLLRYSGYTVGILEKTVELIDTPLDIEKIKADFKHDICNSFEELQDIIHYLFDFYSHLCKRIAEYENIKEEKQKKEKWPAIFRSCSYTKRTSSWDEYHRKNESFWDAFNVLRSPYWLPFIEKEFEQDIENKFFNDFRNTGSFLSHFNTSKTDECNSFIILFMNGIIEIANSLSSCTQKVPRISNIDELENIVKILSTPSNDYACYFVKDTDEIPCWHVDKDKLSETEKIVFTAISSITTSLRTGAKEYSSQLNSKDWFSFMESLVHDKTFCMKEEQKTKCFILFQKELDEKNNSSFRDFVLQLTGIFEYTGFITCIDLALEELESLRTDTDEYGLLYSDAWYKISFDFIETSLKKMKDKALETKESETASPYSRHSEWIRFLDILYSDETFRVDEFPIDIDNWYWDEESFTEKEKYDGITSFKPLNLKNFRNLFNPICHELPRTFATILSDIFHINDNYWVRNENTVLDRYKYSGLMKNNPFIHSSVAQFYHFLYGFFTLLRTNICTLTPYNLSQSKILEYSLSSYVASFISNTRNSFDKDNKKEDIRNFTKGKLFANRYFEEKNGSYKPSMKNANSALKNSVEKAGLPKGESLKKLANCIDTKKKRDILIHTPATSAYVLTQILKDDSLFPKEISPRTIKKYRADYLNYYLLCNFIKALTPFFDGKQENVEKLFSEIVAGILSYPFCNLKKLEKQPVKSGFQHLLRKDFHKNSFSSSDTCVCNRNHQFIFYPEYFWYSQQKDDKLYKSIFHLGFSHNIFKDFSDIDLAKKHIELIRDKFGDGTGDFYYHYYHGKLEYKAFVKREKNASIKVAVEQYEKAFKYIYHAGRKVDDFVTSVFNLYAYIQESNIPNVPTLPLKRIWQWAEAAGVVDRSYEILFGKVKKGITVGLPMWKDHVRLDNSDSKVLNNLERLIADIDSDIDERNK
ncbi:MAG: hypothetical protein IKW26_03650 [Treponema sp.]|nr:hypothetical protein [Treponema sp.]